VAVFLIVDDEIFIRDLAELVIGDLGHETLVAGDIEEALSALQSSGHVDALFTDIRLRKLVHGGFELAEQAVRLRPNLRVLYTTGSVNDDDMKVMGVPGAQMLQKPYGPEELQNSVEKLLAANS
jgi:CheY-like chemotaxis protein